MPLALGGWHHEWSPGVHTLFLGGRLENTQHFSDIGAEQSLANPQGFLNPWSVPFDVSYENTFETYTAEWNQIFQRERHTDILGVRYQSGTFEATASLDNPPAPAASWFTLPENSTTDANLSRLSIYAYHHWEILDNLLLIGGLAYDWLDYPANYRRPPLESGNSHTEGFLPKAALIWDLTSGMRLRGMYSEAIGGVSFEDSVRLEPTQLAGFAQSYRTLISESRVGSVEALTYQLAGAALDLRPATNTWLSLQAESLRQEGDQDFGFFSVVFGIPTSSATPANTTEELEYQEWRARVVANQILGREWFLEVQYQFTHSALEQSVPAIPASSSFDRTTTSYANLHQGGLAATWQSPTGFFARGEFWWYAQELGGDGVQPPGDSFPQLNLFTGYRFPKRRGELTVGVLNLTDQDYSLDPLNYHLELPRERTFYVRLQFNF
jgi:hypothetical protein